jgi:hypothetical protein
MTFGGRSAFFIGVGLFASGSGNAGFSGLVLVGNPVCNLAPGAEVVLWGVHL